MKNWILVLIAIVPWLALSQEPIKNPRAVQCGVEYREGSAKTATATAKEIKNSLGAVIPLADGVIEYWSTVTQTDCVDCSKSWDHDFQTKLKFIKLNGIPQYREVYGLYEKLEIQLEEPSQVKSVQCEFME